MNAAHLHFVECTWKINCIVILFLPAAEKLLMHLNVSSYNSFSESRIATRRVGTGRNRNDRYGLGYVIVGAHRI